jgi:hypothetical protein
MRYLPGQKKTGVQKPKGTRDADGILTCIQGHKVSGYNKMITGGKERCRTCHKIAQRKRYRKGNPKFEGLKPTQYPEPKHPPREVLACSDCDREGRIKSDFVLKGHIDYLGRDLCTVCHHKARLELAKNRRAAQIHLGVYGDDVI